MNTIAYTHWAYFDDEASAKAAVADLPDFVTRVCPSVADTEHRFLLLAGRDVPIDDLVERHAYVQAIVERHGGLYDGGEATYGPDGSVADPTLTGDWGAS